MEQYSKEDVLSTFKFFYETLSKDFHNHMEEAIELTNIFYRQYQRQ